MATRQTGHILSWAAHALQTTRCPHGMSTTSRAALWHTTHSSNDSRIEAAPAPAPIPTPTPPRPLARWCCAAFEVFGCVLTAGVPALELRTGCPIEAGWVPCGGLVMPGGGTGRDGGADMLGWEGWVGAGFCVDVFGAVRRVTPVSSTVKLIWWAGKLRTGRPKVFSVVVNGAISVPNKGAVRPICVYRCWVARRSSTKRALIWVQRFTKSRGSNSCFSFICSSYSHTASTSSCALSKPCPTIKVEF